MKKFVSLCAFVAALSFVSCGGNTANTAAILLVSLTLLIQFVSQIASLRLA